MKNEIKERIKWSICQKCHGQGKKRHRLSKKVKLQHQKALDLFEKTEGEGEAPVLPKSHLNPCSNCSGTGIIRTDTYPIIEQEKHPHIAIIGGGIGGVALAVACLHRGIPFTLYERDSSFNSRSQGYGLTLQQASKVVASFGILTLKEGVVSTKHIVHNSKGEVIGEWGMRKWVQSDTKIAKKNTNIHIARQSLRLALLDQLSSHDVVQWKHQLVDFKESKTNGVDLEFIVNGHIKTAKADLVVGADGIRSTVRKILIGQQTPLRYLGCIVILGICPLSALENLTNPLLDSATVFQTVNGHERIYMMPYTSDSIMWQLSFPISEKKAKKLSLKGSHALKEEACLRTHWHEPIPQIITATQVDQVSGYPVYDRELLSPELLSKNDKVTLIGDAAHPMSPFKGQGANQALLDALALAREVSKGFKTPHQLNDVNIYKSVLSTFESEMLTRTAIKVKDSAIAAKLLHSDSVLHKADKPRGKE